jgi:plastocyanin
MPGPNAIFPGHRVSITPSGFDPDRVEVRVGATVTFTNNDAAPHTLTIGAPVPLTTIVAPGESYAYVPDVPGTFPFRDQSGSSGTLVVSA